MLVLFVGLAWSPTTSQPKWWPNIQSNKRRGGPALPPGSALSALATKPFDFNFNNAAPVEAQPTRSLTGEHSRTPTLRIHYLFLGSFFCGNREASGLRGRRTGLAGGRPGSLSHRSNATCYRLPFIRGIMREHAKRQIRVARLFEYHHRRTSREVGIRFVKFLFRTTSLAVESWSNHPNHFNIPSMRYLLFSRGKARRFMDPYEDSE